MAKNLIKVQLPRVITKKDLQAQLANKSFLLFEIEDDNAATDAAIDKLLYEHQNLSNENRNLKNDIKELKKEIKRLKNGTK